MNGTAPAGKAEFEKLEKGTPPSTENVVVPATGAAICAAAVSACDAAAAEASVRSKTGHALPPPQHTIVALRVRRVGAVEIVVIDGKGVLAVRTSDRKVEVELADIHPELMLPLLVQWRVVRGSQDTLASRHSSAMMVHNA